jgi:hypothetical protein
MPIHFSVRMSRYPHMHYVFHLCNPFLFNQRNNDRWRVQKLCSSSLRNFLYSSLFWLSKPIRKGEWIEKGHLLQNKNICLVFRNVISYSDWLRAGRSDDRGSIPGGGWEFFSSTPCTDQLWCSPSLLSNGYPGALCLGLKRPGREADHSFPSSAEVKEYVSMVLCLVKRRDNFTFTIWQSLETIILPSPGDWSGKWPEG